MLNAYRSENAAKRQTMQDKAYFMLTEANNLACTNKEVQLGKMFVHQTGQVDKSKVYYKFSNKGTLETEQQNRRYIKWFR